MLLLLRTSIAIELRSHALEVVRSLTVDWVRREIREKWERRENILNISARQNNFWIRNTRVSELQWQEMML